MKYAALALAAAILGWTTPAHAERARAPASFVVCSGFHLYSADDGPAGLNIRSGL